MFKWEDVFFIFIFSKIFSPIPVVSAGTKKYISPEKFIVSCTYNRLPSLCFFNKSLLDLCRHISLHLPHFFNDHSEMVQYQQCIRT